MKDTEDIGAAIARCARGVEAPPRLRERLAARPARPPRARLIAALVAGAAIVALAFALGAGGPSVAQVAAAGLRAPTRPAPHGRAYLAGYRPVGARTDEVDGRRAVTVIYRRATVGVHYTILDGDLLELPGTRRVGAGGLRLALDRDGDVNLVAWHARGKTCILASRAETLTGLVRLAAGTGRGAGREIA